MLQIRCYRQLPLPKFQAFRTINEQKRPNYSSTKPKLLDRVRNVLRVKHYAIRTEQAYTHWIKRYILFHHKRHPLEMNSAEIEQFLTHLAVEQNVAASTQNQALAALLFLYQEVW